MTANQSHNPATSDVSSEKAQSEPQNQLTQRFTEAEWNALRRLRPMLPEIRRLAYESDTPKTFSIWGVTIDPTDPAADARVSVVLMKFLRARKLDVGSTKTLLIELLRWRQEVNIDELVNREFPRPRSPAVKFGKDKAGRPVLYNQITVEAIKRMWVDLDEDSKAVIQQTTRNLEKLARYLDYESVDQVTRVADMESMSADDFTNNRPPNAVLARIVSNYYPNLSAHRLAVNAPLLLSMFARVSSFFVTPEDGTMRFVGRGKETVAKKLLEIIDAEQLPKQYGGKADGFFWPTADATQLIQTTAQINAAIEKRV